MATEYDATRNDLVTRAKDILQVLASITVIAGTLWLVLIFLTGGLKSQDQFAVQDLTKSVAGIQLSIAGLSAQISSMPRPSDYAGLIERMHELDLRNNALAEQIIQQRIEFARLTALTDAVSRKVGVQP